MTTLGTPTPIQDATILAKEILDRARPICHIRRTPLVLRGMLVEVTRRLYSEAETLPVGVETVYDEDPRKSRIWIDADFVWEDEHPEFRPAIYVKLSPLQYRSLTGRRDGRMHMDLEQGEYFHTRNGVGTATWIHVGRTAGEACQLAGVTLDYLDALGPVIKQDLSFESFHLVGSGPLAMVARESRERYTDMVSVAFAFQDTWSLKYESPKLKRLVQTLETA